jgi:hypothetical protein|tara:strand:+ start:83 stop:295 length:213 start_codon:yes stop_codon:yes gene_type:complete
MTYLNKLTNHKLRGALLPFFYVLNVENFLTFSIYIFIIIYFYDSVFKNKINIFNTTYINKGIIHQKPTLK